MESAMYIHFFRNGFVLIWISWLKWSVYNTHQCTSMMKMYAHESFSLKFEINIKIWVYSEHWGVLFASRGWPQASQVCCDSQQPASNSKHWWTRKDAPWVWFHFCRTNFILHKQCSSYNVPRDLAFLPLLLHIHIFWEFGDSLTNNSNNT